MSITARPRKDTFDYFPHDTDAAHDEKIEAMRALYGNDGYAFYFILLERIYRSNGVLDVKNPAIMAAIKQNVTPDVDLFDKMLKTAFELRLFDQSMYDGEGILSSPAIERRVAPINSERIRKRSWAQDRKDKEVLDVENPAKTASNSGVMLHKVKVKDKENTPVAPKGATGTTYDSRFESFWTAYPKKVGKGAAERAFKKYKPDASLLEVMLAAVEQQRQSDQWQREGGQYIPNPATWLNQKRWEDELAAEGTKSNRLEGAIL